MRFNSGDFACSQCGAAAKGYHAGFCLAADRFKPRLTLVTRGPRRGLWQCLASQGAPAFGNTPYASYAAWARCVAPYIQPRKQA